MAIKIDWEDHKQVIQFLVFLYRRQTDMEQVSSQTTDSNGVGFNKPDSNFMTSLAQRLMSGRSLTEAQYAVAHQVLRKYHGQAESGYETSMDGISTEVMPVVERPDGSLRYDDTQKVFRFIPEVYPTTQVKTLGFRWNSINRSSGVWISSDNSPSVVAAIIEMFPRIKVDKSVIDYLAQIKEYENEIISTLESTSLFRFQKEGVAFLDAHSKAMLAYAPGLGKTATAIHAANATSAGKNILVVAPLTLCQNWRKEIKKWVGGNAQIWRQEVRSPSRWVITNYDTVSKKVAQLKDMRFETVILDESVLLKNRKAVRTKACAELCKGKENVWMLSGSPTTKFLDDMWSQLNILNPIVFSSYWRFANTYCYVEKNQWGMRIVNNQEGAIERLQRDVSQYYICRNHQDLIRTGELNIPDWIFDNVAVEMSKSQYQMYQSMEDQFLAILPSGDELLAPNVLSQLIRLIQIASNPVLIDGDDDSNKWEAALDMLEYEGSPVIMWTSFKKTAHELAIRLVKQGQRVAMLTGNTPADQRQPIVDAFQEGRMDALVAHPAVGKFGLTLTRAKTSIYVERNYNGDDYYQSLYRNRRIGTTSSPHVIHLLSTKPDGSGTIDHVIHRILRFRKDESIGITGKMIREAFNDNEEI